MWESARGSLPQDTAYTDIVAPDGTVLVKAGKADQQGCLEKDLQGRHTRQSRFVLSL